MPAVTFVTSEPVSLGWSYGEPGEWGRIGRLQNSGEIMYEALGAIYLKRDVPDRVDGALYRKEGRNLRLSTSLDARALE